MSEVDILETSNLLYRKRKIENTDLLKSDSGIFDGSLASTPNDEFIIHDQENIVRRKINSYQIHSFDQLAPTNNLITSNASEPIKIRSSDFGSLADEPLTVMTMLQRTMSSYPNHPAFVSKVNGEWIETTYQEYYNLVILAAKSFIYLGLDSFHGVSVLGFNSKEWIISYVAAIFAGGLATGIYTTNGPESCQYILDHSDAQIVVVENKHQLDKILKIKSKLPMLKAVVVYKDEVCGEPSYVYDWSSFIKLGERVKDLNLIDRWNLQAPNKCCSLIYTSGTTGDAKGVMLCHDNFIWTSGVLGPQGDIFPATEIIVSYLPLSHVAAQILDIFLPMTFAATVYFAQPDALKGSLGETLKEVRPTIFLGVPRVWEKMQERMIEIGRSRWFFQKKIVELAKYIGLWGNTNLMNGDNVPYGWMLADLLVFRKVKQALGFDRVRYCFTAAAPILKDTLMFFMSLNLPIMEIYGMSESSGPHTISFPWRYRAVSVGVELEGCSTKFIDEDEEGCGEICMNGRNIFMGYLKMPDKTIETFDKDGWLKTGDVGRRDADGFIYITGRIKELIITAGGENVAPVPIENRIKELLPCLSNCMLVGDQKKFLSILLTFKTEFNSTTLAPTDLLSSSVHYWLKSIGCQEKIEKLSELRSSRSFEIKSALQTVIDRVNKMAISRAQCIQKWDILPRDFSIYHGELGPTLKLRRSVVSKMYKASIDQLYNENIE